MSRVLPVAFVVLMLPLGAFARPLHRRAPSPSVRSQIHTPRYPALDRMIHRFAAEARKKQMVAER